MHVPWFLSSWWLVLLFAMFCVVFHFTLVVLYPLDSIAWKRVDYVWLPFALVGALGAIAANRTAVAQNQLELATSRATFAFEQVKTFLGSTQDLPLCQRSSDQTAQCAWFIAVRKGLDGTDAKKFEAIDLVKLAGPAPAATYGWPYQTLENHVRWFNENAADVHDLESLRKRGPLEDLLQFLGPFLLVVALALRLTRVTGEISIERKRQQAEA